LRETSEKFVLKPHLRGELQAYLRVPPAFRNPLQFRQKHATEYPIMSETPVHPCQFSTVGKRLFFCWIHCNWHAVRTKREHCRSPWVSSL